MHILPMPGRSGGPAARRRAPVAGRALRLAGATGLALAAALALAADDAGHAAPAGADTYQVTRHAIAGGGTARAHSACFDLAGTIGQPVTGVSSGGDFIVTSGFWTGVRLDDSILRTSFEDCDP
ncbi:MAG TPA: hypothetical protein VMR06_10470 [Dokdonella sp.]|uniref:hypothetical protein n=1 Tax=Dokdonella sp. TaxID=2291710 RepID=UPI002C19E687|nr:hypothetical protein [Dokdonella sp.]HUD42403.1 hypothetical protein [Dokdonella sp.]